MPDDEKNIGLVILERITSLWTTTLLVFPPIAYFFYGKNWDGIDAAVAVFLLWILWAAALLLALIPFMGFSMQAFVMYNMIWPWICALTGITSSPVIEAMFWGFAGIGFFITLAMSIIILNWLWDKLF